MRRLVLLAVAVWMLPAGRAQLTLGELQGSADAGAPVEIDGPLGPALRMDADPRGRFSAILPYGIYTVRAASLGAVCRVQIQPHASARCDLHPGQTEDNTSAPPTGVLNAAQYLLGQAPGVFTYPLDFGGLGNIRLPLISAGGASWTATAFHLNGLDASDSYQPGTPVLPDDAAADEFVADDGRTVDVFLAGAGNSWHGGLATRDTGAAFAGNNLPKPAERGSVLRPDEFLWFTRDTAELGGPLGRWADILATATGQWAYQTAPERPSAAPIGSRMLFANTRGQVRLSARDRLDALYSGSRLDLSNGGWPAGMEAILANRAMPSFYGVEGFQNLRETDHFDLVQAGWTHTFAGGGAVEARYGYSTAHLDTSPIAGQNTPSQIDLLDLAPADAPLSNFAVRTRHQGAVAWQSGPRRFAGLTHRFTATAAAESSQPRNRFQATAGTDLISAAGESAFTVRLNTPTDTRARIDSFALSLADTLQLAHGIALDGGLALDAVRGHPGAVSWTSLAPRIGLSAPAPGLSRLTLRADYARIFSALPGRFLDFADPGSLSGLVYSAQNGQLLERFGGAYSSIDPHLARPYTDRFQVAAQLALPLRSDFSVDFERSDEKHRIAAVNTGVTAADFTPVFVTDPGPDYLSGTFDDQALVVYAQQPNTLGRDQYLLTNPAGLRELTESLTAAAGTHHQRLDLRASFTAEKSFGPTNPGSSIWVNDPGVLGALYSDPNSLIHATGHPFMDRAFLGKIQAAWTAPARAAGLRFTSTLNYLDGIPFARELLIQALSQGPFLVDTTLRGSPEGGNRAQYVLNWNLRIGRDIVLPFGRLELTADLLNVLNNGNTIEQSDLSGPQFNSRPALAIPPPRTLRLGFRWLF